MTDSVRLANAPLSKTMPSMVGLFKIVLPAPDTVTIFENDIHNTVSIDGVTHDPSIIQADEAGARRLQWDASTLPATPSSGKPTYSTDSPMHTYSIERVVRHIGAGEKMRYAVGWHSHRPTGDTTEPLHHILHNFIAQYRKKRSCTPGQRRYLSSHKLCQKKLGLNIFSKS